MYPEKVGENAVKLLSCKESVRFWAEGQMDEASWWDRLSFRLHLISCLICRKYVRQLVTLGRAFDQSSHESVSSQRVADLKKRILHKLSI